MTLSLLIYSSHNKVSPLIKLLMSNMSSIMLNASVAHAHALLHSADVLL